MRAVNPTNTSTEKRTSRTIAVLVVLALHEVDEDLQLGKTQAPERKRKILQNLHEYRFVGNVRGEHRIVKHRGAQTIQEPREAMSMGPLPCSLRPAPASLDLSRSVKSNTTMDRSLRPCGADVSAKRTAHATDTLPRARKSAASIEKGHGPQ